jgi:GNAT superfamily N-acetyltransferase
MPSVSSYLDIPPGKLAMVVTSLEMRARPALAPDPAVPWILTRIERPDLADYRALFRRVGADYLWFARLAMADAALRAILDDPAYALHRVEHRGRAEGLLELDFRVAGQCELAYFGLAPGLIGRGAGRWLMNRALDLAWAPGVARVWVHSCTLDHPAALGFYQRSGFIPYRRQVEIADDPRLTGLLPRDAAPAIPIL